MGKRILILGGRGMLGHVLLRHLNDRSELDVYSTVFESQELARTFPINSDKIIFNINVEIFDRLLQLFLHLKPDVVINCVAVTKQQQIMDDIVSAININSQVPHRIALLCQSIGSRFIHISTDSLFGDLTGMHTENDQIFLSNIYSMTKFLGEVNYSNCVTLRTSIIGHEVVSKTSFLEWFLSQKEKIKGYSNVIYSGLPTIELSEIISDYILEDHTLSGIYHVSSSPISKYNLLKLIAEKYEKQIELEPCDSEVRINRSLDSSLFRSVTGYTPPPWEVLVRKMYDDYIKYKRFY